MKRKKRVREYHADIENFRKNANNPCYYSLLPLSHELEYKKWHTKLKEWNGAKKRVQMIISYF
jgi:hypothetical protein